jgi:hypothetical protein
MSLQISDLCLVQGELEVAAKEMYARTNSYEMANGSVHHCKACSEKSNDRLSDARASVHAVMMPMSIPLTTGWCTPKADASTSQMDVTLEKIPVVGSEVQVTNSTLSIQLLKSDLHQVLRVAFARDITKLAQEHEGRSHHQSYGRTHKMCMSPVGNNELITIQLLIQKKVKWVVFDNDAKGCYDRIVSIVAMVTL